MSEWMGELVEVRSFRRDARTLDPKRNHHAQRRRHDLATPARSVETTPHEKVFQDG